MEGALLCEVCSGWRDGADPPRAHADPEKGKEKSQIRNESPRAPVCADRKIR
jgi:hypothetical protein